MKIYLVHPINGEKYENIQEYYNEIVPSLKGWGYHPLCPLLDIELIRTSKEERANCNKNPESTNQAITHRDKWLVEQCDMVYANLTESSRVSIGSMFELAWAYDKGKHIVISLPEDNIHNHAFVLASSDVRFTTHDDAMNYLEMLSNNVNYGTI